MRCSEQSNMEYYHGSNCFLKVELVFIIDMNTPRPRLMVGLCLLISPPAESFLGCVPLYPAMW